MKVETYDSNESEASLYSYYEDTDDSKDLDNWYEDDDESQTDKTLIPFSMVTPSHLSQSRLTTNKSFIE